MRLFHATSALENCDFRLALLAALTALALGFRHGAIPDRSSAHSATPFVAAPIINHIRAPCRYGSEANALGEGDSVSLAGEITHVLDDGRVTVRVHGFDYPITLRSEYVSLLAKRQSPKRR